MDIIADGPVLKLSGDVDVRSTSRIREAIRAQMAAHEGDITLDVTDVVSIDLTALRVVAAAGRRAACSGQSVVLRGATGGLLRMLHLSRLIRFVRVDRESAVV